MAELLLELLSEEIPARMQTRAAADLKRLVCDGLTKAGLEFTKAEAFATPRRLALVVDGIPERTPDIREEKRGPQVGAPEQAIKGFLGSLGGLSINDCEQREIKGKTYYVASVETSGRSTTTVIPEIFFDTVVKFPWTKSMRWGKGVWTWVRPIHSVLALFDGKAIDLEGYRDGLDAMMFPNGSRLGVNKTVGHRFLAPEPFAVKNFVDYKTKLGENKVMLDPAGRRAIIATTAKALAEAEGLTVRDDPALLDEVAGLVEWPVVLIGGIDDAFMEVPPEVLITSMRSHQKYFSCLDADGELANRFIVVANTEATDGGAEILAGNERVLRARLSDAKFFWDQDRKQTLDSRAPALADRVFHAKLGSVADKVVRMQALAAKLAAFVPGADTEQARTAAGLAKCDLSTGMVGEFPDLQGVIGRYYALNDGETAAVADAIAEHYAPQGPNDACPSAPVSVCVALADKIDSLVGFFAIDEKPTGSKDPFALRRAALGVIRLILENGLRLPLAPVFGNSAADLLAFFADRLKVHLKQRGVRHDAIDAVFGLGGEDDLVRLLERVDALSDFLASEDGGDLLTAYRRAANILKIEEKKDGRGYGGEPDGSLFEQHEETALAAGLATAGTAIAETLADEDYAGAMKALAGLRAPVDAFFDAVTVNCDDPALRENRLKLLNGIRSALDGVADFSRIEG